MARFPLFPLFALFLVLAATALGGATSQQTDSDLESAPCDCPCDCPDNGGLSLTWYSGSSPWWLAVTIQGSNSVEIDCGNGQGYVSMTPGWAQYMWAFSSSNGQACRSTVSFIVNGGATVTVQAPY